MPSSPQQAHVSAADLPHFRAAYSDRTAALMATLARLAYEVPPTATALGSPALPTAFVPLGFNQVSYFHNGLDDGWAYVAEGPDIIVVAFRGTKSIKNWCTNFQVRMVHPMQTDANLCVHEGFYRAFCDLNDGRQGLHEKIEDLKLATGGNIPIYFTGHSLGGALAQIATAVLASDQVAACYTFGSPRVGNKYFDLWVKPPSYRLVNDADIVPQIPFLAPHWPLTLYQHSGDPRFLPEQTDGTVYRYEPGPLTRAWQIMRGILQFLRHWSILEIEDHAMTLYEQKLAAVKADRSQARDKAPISSLHDGTLDFDRHRIKRGGQT